jgi:hypothetical protein
MFILMVATKARRAVELASRMGIKDVVDWVVIRVAITSMTPQRRVSTCY